MWEYLLDLVFPRFCLFCNQYGADVCEICSQKKFQRYTRQQCHICRQLTRDRELVHKSCAANSSLDGVLVAVHYSAEAKRYLEQFKYNYYRSFAQEIVQMMTFTLANSQLEYSKITAVPLHRKREWERGFNQAEVLAKLIDKRKYTSLLIRKHHTSQQAKLLRYERLENVKDVFVIKQNISIPKSVLLVDDVMTTGATLEECAKVLKKAGVSRVYACVWARGD